MAQEDDKTRYQTCQHDSNLSPPEGDTLNTLLAYSGAPALSTRWIW